MASKDSFLASGLKLKSEHAIVMNLPFTCATASLPLSRASTDCFAGSSLPLTVWR